MRGHKRDVCYLQKVTLVYRLLPAPHFCFNAIVYRLFLGSWFPSYISYDIQSMCLWYNVLCIRILALCFQKVLNG